MEDIKNITGLEKKSDYLKSFCEKYKIDLSTLTNKEIKYLIYADIYYEDAYSRINNLAKTANEEKPSIDKFCKACGVTRAAIYKKEPNGTYKYQVLVSYLKEKNKYEKMRCSNQIRYMYKDELTMEQELLNTLLKKEALYQMQQNEIEQKDRQIASLKKEVDKLKKQIKMNYN